jgi:hypothetical protein
MINSKKKELLATLGLVLLILLMIASGNTNSQAAPEGQLTVFPSPTPGPDGRIIYIVQEDDSWWLIAAIFGIELEQLLDLNNTTINEIPQPGDELLLGLAGPAEEISTPGPSPTPEELLPTPTPQPGSGTLCVFLFNDRNGDSRSQQDESSIPGGAISITDQAGLISITETTLPGYDPQCFEDLPEGEYTVSVAIPEGYNPTTALTHTLPLQPGSRTFLDFGAQASSESIAKAPDSNGSGGSAMLGVVGFLLVLGGIALAVFAGKFSRLFAPR